MPFPMQTPQPFTQESIERLPPSQLGVYGLMSKSKWVYIGAGEIRESLLAQFANQTPCVCKHKPTLFLFELTHDPDKREKQLLREFQPICNGQLAHRI